MSGFSLVIHMPSIANMPRNVQVTANIFCFTGHPYDASIKIYRREGNRKLCIV
jgi:hypothetical protein